jgi:hypothetical protein
MRLGAFSTFAINYALVVELTPTLYTGLVFAIVNTVCRSVTIVAPICAELLTNSSWTCTIFAVAGILAVDRLEMNTKLEKRD